MPTDDRRDLFDAWAGDYESSVHDQSAYPFLGYDAVLDRIVAVAGVTRGQSVLDLGVGTGNLAGRCLARGADVTGTDFSPTMLERTRSRHPGVRLVAADLSADLRPIEALVADGPRFDRIVSAYVLHEFPLATKVGLLRRLVDGCLAADGCVVVGDLAFATDAARTSAAATWADRWDPDEHPWAADETIRPLTEVGLAATWEPVSPCAGVFVIRPRAGPAAAIS